jgi:hypothetical protein
MLESHPRPSTSELLGVGPAIDIFVKLPRDSKRQPRLKTHFSKENGGKRRQYQTFFHGYFLAP